MANVCSSFRAVISIHLPMCYGINLTHLHLTRQFKLLRSTLPYYSSFRVVIGFAPTPYLIFPRCSVVVLLCSKGVTRKGIFRITPSALTDTGYVLLVPISFGSWSKIQVITLVLAWVLSLQHVVTECHFFVEVSSVDCPLTGMGGIEPPIKESKSFALPLGYIPI